ncbi:MAG: DUF5317 family protein [Parcubacteria group bacterium]|nr:DUF5317 family protein [Parcubacteria group bacterium]
MLFYLFYSWKKDSILALGIFLLMVGAGLNMSVVCANGYKMPVFGIANYDVTDARHCLLDATTKFALLSDHIQVSDPLLAPNVILMVSIGDILIYVGYSIVFPLLCISMLCASASFIRSKFRKK